MSGGEKQTTCMVIDPVTGRADVTRVSPETFQTRWIDRIHRAPWMVDVYAAIPSGLAFSILPANATRLPYLRQDFVRPFVLVVGDDFLLAHGPHAFHAPILRRFVKAAAFVGLVPRVPDRAFYGAAVRAAMARKRPAVVIETQPQQRDAWLRWVARYAKVPVEICGEREAAA